MCGIVGYAGRHQALPVLLAGLRRLEYRGYDSAGLALLEPHFHAVGSVRVDHHAVLLEDGSYRRDAIGVRAFAGNQG